MKIGSNPAEAGSRPSDIPLPPGWTWELVEAQRAKWGIADDMVPIASAGGCVAWGTINSVRIANKLLGEYFAGGRQ